MSPQSDEKLGYRVLIEGTLTANTFLHIGSDKPVEEVAEAKRRRAEAQADDKPGDKDKGIPLPVVTGRDKKGNNTAIIPASALRGALRSRLKRYGLDEDLMGRAAEPGGEESLVHGKARRVFVHDATIMEPSLQGLEFDNSERCVDEIAMTAISRWRRAPQDEMLRNVEAVPPEVTFNVRIGICGDPAKEVKERVVTRDEVAKVLAALGHCDWRQDSAGSGVQTPAAQPLFKPLQLGAFQKAGWGKVEWKTCKVTALTSEGLTKWLGSKQNPVSDKRGWELCSEPIGEKSFVRPEPPDTLDNVIYLPLTLAFESTFFTVDQRQHTRDAVIREVKAAKQRDEDYPEKLAKVMRVNGRAWLSGQSLKGALRSQFERILRTKGIYCCDPSLKEEDWPEEKKTKFHTGPCCPPIRSASEIGKLCFACQVFGNGGWASTIEVSSFEEVPEYTKNTRREFLAISRFTGGGVPGLKFSADVAVRPKLSGGVSINLTRLAHELSSQDKENGKKEPAPADAKLGALLHLFRDFAEGDIPVGAGRSKGSGKFKLAKMSDESVATLSKQPVGVALCAILGKANTPGETLLLQKEAHGWLAEFDKRSPAVVNAAQLWWQSFEAPPGAAPDHSEVGQVNVQAGSYNPYHWVPAAQADGNLLTAVTNFGKEPVHRHDIYAQDGISGEMTVRVKAVTPIFVGGERKSKGEVGHPAKVDPFTINGSPAIPSTTLRGLLSSTYEIATASAMRVLDAEKIYSYRMAAAPSETFQFIGKVNKDGTGIIPWARKPGTVIRRPGQPPRLIAALPVPGRLPAEQPLEWQQIPIDDVQSTMNTSAGYYCLNSPGRKLPERKNRKYEIKFGGQPPCQDPILFGPDAIAQFERIADDRTDDSRASSDDEQIEYLPYEPLGQERGGEKNTCRVKPGQFLYFKTDKQGRVVTRIAFSQIWRDDVGKSIGELLGGGNLVPLQLDWKKPAAARTNLTMAETAFGFVWQEENKDLQDPAKNDNRLPAFASRIVVSDATIPGASGDSYTSYALTGGQKALKVLNSPKPPSPAFYFDPVNSHMPTYAEIADPTKSKPRGRKMYLHLAWNKTSRPWESQQPQQDWDRAKVERGVSNNEKVKKLQTAVECVKEDTTFTFTVAFDNLGENEFLSLCYALRPAPNYCHKLGMGKPLGLGSVSLDVDNVRILDRLNRYTTDGFGAGRFCMVEESEASEWIDARAKKWKNSVRSKTDLWNSLTVLETIGATRVKRMQYPMKRNQADDEWELFQWPSENRSNAASKHGGEMAHAMLPIAEPSLGEEDRLKFPVPRTPSPCSVVIIKPQRIRDVDQVTGYTRDALQHVVVPARDEAGTAIKKLPTDAVVYLVSEGAAGNVPYHGRSVRRVEITSLEAPSRDDQTRLERLKEALALGAAVQT